MIKLSSENKDVQTFLDYVHSSLRKYKIKLILSLETTTIGKNQISGYFDDASKELLVCINEPNWIETLVHEFCHFLQFKEQDPLYTSLDQGDSNYLSEVWDWLDNKHEFVSTKRKNEAFRKIIDMELDCERRSVEMIKRFKLPINLEDYEYTAFVYIHFYNFCKKYRTWFSDGVSVADIVEISDLEDKYKISLDGDFRKLPPEFEEIFKKYAKKT
jgi:hypothetical protein